MIYYLINHIGVAQLINNFVSFLLGCLFGALLSY